MQYMQGKQSCLFLHTWEAGMYLLFTHGMQSSICCTQTGSSHAYHVLPWEEVLDTMYPHRNNFWIQCTHLLSIPGFVGTTLEAVLV